MLEVSTALGQLRQAPCHRRRVAQRRPRRDRGHAGRQRRRQVVVPQGAGRRWSRICPARASTLAASTSRALPPHAVVEAGLALVPEDRGIFADLTVRENLQLGAFTAGAPAAREARISSAWWRCFPRLAERMGQLASTMSGGERQMVAIGRALMSSPRHPAARRAVAGAVAAGLQRAVPGAGPHQGAGRRRAAGRAERAGQALAIADRGYLLENGRIVGEGAAADPAGRPGRAPRLPGRRRAWRQRHAPAPQRGAAARNGRIAVPAAQPGAQSRATAAVRMRLPRTIRAGHGTRRHAIRTTSAYAAAHAPMARVARSHVQRRPVPEHGPPPVSHHKQTIPGSETMIAVDLMINNADAKAAGNATFDRLNPMTGEVASRAAASSADDADARGAMPPPPPSRPGRRWRRPPAARCSTRPPT